MKMPLKSHSQYLPDEKHSQIFAERLADCLFPSLILGFSGDLGAGKTTMIRAMLRQLGIKSAIKSPTYALVESYFSQGLPIHHFDLYRIQEADELEYIGFRDYFSSQAICCIEWPEKAASQQLLVDLHLFIQMAGSGREMHIEALTSSGKKLLDCLLDKS